MAFNSTANRSHLCLVREVEAIGGNVKASASRDQMSFTYEALKTYVPQMVELLVDSVRNQVFLDWEVKDQIQKVKAEISECANNPETLLLEAVHSAGYSGALANPLIASEASLNRLDNTILEQFVSVEEPKSVYLGGDRRVKADTGRTSFALAFGLPGGWLNMKEAMTLTVLQMLMGGGDSFSAGGPGKGMYSRLSDLRVLNEYPEIPSFSAFNFIYSNTALFGIQGTTSPKFARKAIDLVVEDLETIRFEGAVRPEQLDRAKQSTKSAILMNLESRTVASEDIGRQIMIYGESYKCTILQVGLLTAGLLMFKA
ncbi:hypothetical protein L1987_53591 [Smallanthus sonchifolius]|uniref:Uncharacterized protein n=1 Tax=Smallanthus sonchifolius TaxID=185202 RepID=A0ACB9EWN8_9ASTR|nr:hypothetical protein L1987_53591 [Smallanthus sonchifolius]